MKRRYTVNAINSELEILFSNEAKTIKEVKNIIAELNGRYSFTVVKNNKLVKRLSSKSALEILKNF
jgi:hypothetical protein